MQMNNHLGLEFYSTKVKPFAADLENLITQLQAVKGLEQECIDSNVNIRLTKGLTQLMKDVLAAVGEERYLSIVGGKPSLSDKIGLNKQQEELKEHEQKGQSSIELDERLRKLLDEMKDEAL